MKKLIVLMLLACLGFAIYKAMNLETHGASHD